MATDWRSFVLKPTLLAKTPYMWAGWLAGCLAAGSVEVCERILASILGWFGWGNILPDISPILYKGVIGFVVFTIIQYLLAYVMGGRGNLAQFAATMGFSWLPLLAAALIVTPILALLRLHPLLYIGSIAAGFLWCVRLGIPVIRDYMSLDPARSIGAYVISLAFGVGLFQRLF